MHKSLVIVPALACFASYILTPAEAFGSLTLVLAGTSYVLTASQTTLAIASLAGLAVAKEALILADQEESVQWMRMLRRSPPHSLMTFLM